MSSPDSPEPTSPPAEPAATATQAEPAAAAPLPVEPAATATQAEPATAAGEPAAAPTSDNGHPPSTPLDEPFDWDPYRRALRKRGFHQDDVYRHECPRCGTLRAVEKWGLSGRGGGRDIDLCLACGQSWSWRQRPLREQREVDPDFDLRTFLKM